jgi:parvulin-like peptidyl-prolyl isomerase
MTKLWIAFLCLCTLLLLACLPEALAQAPAAGGEQPPVSVVGEVPVRPELQTFSGVRGWMVNGEEIPLDLAKEKALAWYGPYLLQDLVASTLLHQEAKRKGITVTQADTDAKLAEIRGELGITSDAALERLLRSQQRTPQWFSDHVADYALLEKVLADRVYVSDIEVKNAYDRNPEALTIPETVWYRAMTFRSEEAAQAAKQELRAGKSFEELAKANAATPEERAVAGQLIQYQRGQQPRLQQEVEAALFAAPVNQVSGPLKTHDPIGNQDYYHLFRVEKKTDERHFSLDEARERIRADLRRQKLYQLVYPNWLSEALAGASIQPLPAR